MQGISWPAVNRLDSQQGLCCMEWVNMTTHNRTDLLRLNYSKSTLGHLQKGIERNFHSYITQIHTLYALYEWNLFCTICVTDLKSSRNKQSRITHKQHTNTVPGNGQGLFIHLQTYGAGWSPNKLSFFKDSEPDILSSPDFCIKMFIY
jgi:hypothetical protein